MAVDVAVCGKFTDPSNNKYNPWMDEGMSKVRFDGQAAYIVPPIAPYHPGPAGFAYNPGTALSQKWRGAFFSTSFTGTAVDRARLYALPAGRTGRRLRPGVRHRDPARRADSRDEVRSGRRAVSDRLDRGVRLAAERGASGSSM